MHKLAREHVSGWRHLHGNMSLESKDGKIRRQSAHRHFILCEKLHTKCARVTVRQLKSRTVTRRAGYINGKKLGARHGVICKMLQIVKS